MISSSRWYCVNAKLLSAERFDYCICRTHA